MVFFYTNSILAFLLSMSGSAFVLVSIIDIIDDGIDATNISMILIGILLFLAGRKASQYKEFQKWWKQIKKANLEPEIQKSASIAVEIYSKNPCKWTLQKIRTLNPQAANLIEKSIAKK